ncbi:MAG: hypothetical protein IJ150_11345 [Bacteroidales bacterium]|nr:hypothetical protein [Bacteroidales bacterium]
MTTFALNNLWTYLQGLSLSIEDCKWLARKLIEPNVNDTPTKENSVCPYTKEELNSRFDEIEKEISTGQCTKSEDFFQELDKEFNLGWYK